MLACNHAAKFQFWFLSPPLPASPAPFLLQMYILRKVIETKLREHKIFEDDCYFCSLSSKTIVYKGQLTPEQVCVWGE